MYDEFTSNPASYIEGVVPIHENKARRSKIPTKYLSPIPVKTKSEPLTIGWAGIDAYREQCRITEERNMK